MAIETGIHDLKAKLSAYMGRVKEGETILITDRGKPIGRIVPVGLTTHDQLNALIDAELISWNNQQLAPITPVAHTRADHSMAELLLDNRE